MVGIVIPCCLRVRRTRLSISGSASPTKLTPASQTSLFLRRFAHDQTRDNEECRESSRDLTRRPILLSPELAQTGDIKLCHQESQVQQNVESVRPLEKRGHLWDL